MFVATVMLRRLFPGYGTHMTLPATPPATAPLSPEEALRRVVHCLDREHVSTNRLRAFVRALDVVRSNDPVEIAERARDQRLTELDGIGGTTASIITEALAGLIPTYLAELEATTVVSITDEGRGYLDALRGDCHSHSTWSDGGAEIRAMAHTAIELGHEYLVVTDHSARLTVAHGLDEGRLTRQLDDIAVINQELADEGVGFRLLTGMEVDILADGSLDLSDEMLARLDIVVASVHSKLAMPADEMTQRMVLAVANPHVDILGHCTGRKIGKRPPSRFDADFVFAACARFNAAVEINCRPERLDPPRELIDVAIDHGCWFSIDTDAHATGQLEWQALGCDRAAERGVPLDRVINTMPAAEIVAWAS